MSMPYHDKVDPWSSHSMIYQWVQGKPAGTKILDVGTASGTLGRLCKHKDFYLVGIEPNSDWAALAAPYYSLMIQSALDQVDNSQLSDFDLVILADVLEHMVDPQAALTRMVNLLPDAAEFILSVPNIANLWIRLNLLLGRFEYTDRGILDRTHLRFFTLAALKRMINLSGLQVCEIKSTPIPLNLLNPWFENTFFGKWVFKLFSKFSQGIPTLMGYQFVILARKRGNKGKWD